VNLHASLRRCFLAGNDEQSLDDASADLPLLLPREGLEKARPQPSRSWFAAIVVALCILLALAIFQAPWFHQAEAPIEADLPLIVRVVGEVRVEAASGSRETAAVGDSLRMGETLLVEGENEVAIRYPDGTEIELVGAATLAVGQSPQRGKQLELQGGTLQADVAPQPGERPLLIVTPHARLRVLGTRFELAADAEEGTRLDLESGRVELLRGMEKPLAVEPNSIAIVPPTPDPIRVTPWPAVIDSPQREAAFPGLKSGGFSTDGSTVVAATRWQAVYWYGDGRLEAVPFSRREKKGIFFKHQSRTMLMFKKTDPRELVLWDSTTRKPTDFVTDYFDLPREDQADTNEPKGWRHPTRVAEFSPQGDWVAFLQGRCFRMWDTGRRQWLDYAERYDGKPMAAMASSDDGQWLAIAVRRNTIDVIHPFDGQVVATWRIQHCVPTSLAFSAKRERLAAAFVGRLKVYDVASGDELSTYHEPALVFHRVAMSPDGRIVAASNLSGRIRMWDVDSHAELPMLDVGERVLDLAFADDGKRLAVVTKGRMGIWNVGVENSETISK